MGNVDFQCLIVSLIRVCVPDEVLSKPRAKRGEAWGQVWEAADSAVQKFCAARGKALRSAFICGGFDAVRARFLGVLPKIEAIR
jgi:hypothetical protein